VLILLWASCYRWLCFPSWELALYFSASSYATVGYGDGATVPATFHEMGAHAVQRNYISTSGANHRNTDKGEVGGSSPPRPTINPSVYVFMR
jgi:hypothetical protein